jgi:hypothetical protein
LVHKRCLPAPAVAETCRLTSRNSIEPRFQLMLGYTGAYRTDFSEVIRPQKVYPVRDTDSRLRKIVQNKDMLG